MSYLLLLRSTAIALMLFTINGAYAQCSADAGSDTLICPGGTALLGGTPAATGNGVLQYTWSPATGLRAQHARIPPLRLQAVQLIHSVFSMKTIVFRPLK